MRRYCLALLGVCSVACGVLSHHDAALLRVQYVRFEPAPQLDGAPTTVLNFGLSNKSANDLTQIVVDVSILEKSVGSAARTGAGLIAGPFTIQQKNQNHVLHPGETIDFELRLRNLSSDCKCTAHVNVLSARPSRSPVGNHDPAPAPAPKTPKPPPTPRPI
jgi:hypothetical protein